MPAVCARMSKRGDPPKRRLIVIEGGAGKPPPKKPARARNTRPASPKPKSKVAPARSPGKKTGRAKPVKADDWKVHADRMGFEKMTPAQQVYIERAARLKVIVEAKYKAWADDGFKGDGGKEYFQAEKNYGEALKAAGLKPIDEKAGDQGQGGSSLVK